MTSIAAPDYATLVTYCRMNNIRLSEVTWVHTALDVRQVSGDVLLVTGPGKSFSPIFWDAWLKRVGSGAITPTRLVEIHDKDWLLHHYGVGSDPG